MHIRDTIKTDAAFVSPRGSLRGSWSPDKGAQAVAGPVRRGWSFGEHVAPELLGLWLVEVLACALLLYAPLATGVGQAAASGLHLHAAQAVALALAFGLTSVAVGLYSPDSLLRTRRLLVDTAVGVLLAAPVVWLVGQAVGLDIAGLSGLTPAFALQGLLVWTLVLSGLRLAFSYALRANLFVRRVLIIGGDDAADRLAGTIATLRRGVLDVAPVPQAAADAMLAPRARKLWGVIVTGEASGPVATRQIERAREQGLRIYSETEFWERKLRRIDVERSADGFGSGPRPRSRLDLAAQRFVDIALSLFLLAFTLPLMLLTALLVLVDSPGPVLYRQERVGLHGRVFTLLKFRSMRTDAEARGPVWAAKRDSRVTRVGAFIRLVRIDELPQLMNVLRGEMSFIGPRPERPHFVAQLEQVLPFYSERAQVKPGLTGWAQVNYPYGASVEDARAKLSYDLYCVKHRGWLLDLLILFATVRVVLFQRGAR